jgi:ketosteroid isomerase-like protein
MAWVYRHLHSEISVSAVIAEAAHGQEPRSAGAFRLDFSDGKIRNTKNYWDTGTMARQLGSMG